MTTITNLTPWGFHGIFDCANCDVSSISSESTIRAWLSDVAALVSDGAESDAFIAITGAGNSETEGFSAVQLLNTGTISATFINHDKHVYIDILSHKEFSVTPVEDSIKTHFGSGVTINKIFLPRKAGAVAPNQDPK